MEVSSSSARPETLLFELCEEAGNTLPHDRKVFFRIVSEVASYDLGIVSSLQRVPDVRCSCIQRRDLSRMWVEDRRAVLIRYGPKGRVFESHESPLIAGPHGRGVWREESVPPKTIAAWGKINFRPQLLPVTSF